MTRSDIQSSINKAIADDESLEFISTMLKDYKENGIDQTSVVEVIEEMRSGVTEEYEDRLLEILDIATGHCSIKYIVW